MRDDEYQSIFDLEGDFWWYRGMRDITNAVLGPYLNVRAESRERRLFLDVGCGTGYSIAWIEKTWPGLCGFGADRSRIAASFWPKRGLLLGAVASASLLPYETGSFDLVTCFDVLYQLDPTGAGDAAMEMNRVLRPGGLAFIREPAYDWLRGSHDVAVATKQRFTSNRLNGLLARAGFGVLRTTYANTLLFGLAAARRVISRVLATGGSDVRPASAILNRAFGLVLGLEARYLRRLRLPLGLSVIAVARKPRPLETEDN